ncbi:unnamed protein product [Malus baccata var. baccata]
MDSISQLQEKVNTIATIAFTTIGNTAIGSRPALAPDLNPNQNSTLNSDTEFAKQPKLMNALVAALPLSDGGEEAQLKMIAQLQGENDTVGQQLEKQLEAAELRSFRASEFQEFCLMILVPFK